MPNIEFVNKIKSFFKEKKIPEKYLEILLNFYSDYKNATNKVLSEKEVKEKFDTLFSLLSKEALDPFKFLPYHEKITTPFNYQKFAIDFLKPLVDLDNSKIYNLDNLKKIKNSLEKKENVILLANHQSEVDPMLISILLEKDFSKIANDIIYVAGDRVTTDLIAIPFSMGCNLLCIYSKRYIDTDISLKHQKQLHNKKVMSIMSSLLSEGGKIIYVAPSGGRDRKVEGKIKVAPFDPQSLEMFYLMCKKSKHPTHFFPLTLSTYDVLPPPDVIQVEMGEKRKVARSAIFLSFLPEVDMQNFPGSNEPDKMKKRKNRAKYIHDIVKQEHDKIIKGK